MSEVVYRSQITVTRHHGPLRTATVPAEDRPVTFGVHGAVAEHYGTDPRAPSRTRPRWITWWPRPPGD
jgi:hypothetical protein